MSIRTTQNLLTDSWTANVEEVETAIEHFKSDGTLKNDCHVAFFEIPRDADLHVNVTHKHQTMTASGWIGPAIVPGGFVHNRRFGAAEPTQMIRHIRDMVFAGRCE
jgi:hypothetical protein